VDTDGELSPNEFRSLKCIRNEPHTHDTHKVTFAYSGTWTAAPVCNILFKRGGDPIPPDTEPVTRPYNPISTEPGDITLCVKRYGDEAKMGSFMHTLKPGEEIEAKGPNPQWTWQKGKFTNYGMIAGGTGLTPIIQAVGHILKHDPAAKVTLVCFNKTKEDILLQQELGHLSTAYPDRFVVHHVVETGPKRSLWDHWTRHNLTGRPSAPLLKPLLPPPGPGVFILQCGKPAMTAEVAGPKAKDWTQGPLAGILAELGYNSAQVWKL